MQISRRPDQPTAGSIRRQKIWPAVCGRQQGLRGEVFGIQFRIDRAADCVEGAHDLGSAGRGCGLVRLGDDLVCRAACPMDEVGDTPSIDETRCPER